MWVRWSVCECEACLSWWSECCCTVLFDSPGLNSQQPATTAQPPLFRSSDRATLLEAFRNALSSSQFREVYGSDSAAEPLCTDQTSPQNDLPVVAEESSDDEARGVYARDVEQYEKYKKCEERMAGHGYSCDHCHCSVCKRSLEQHECQRGSVSSSSEPEVMSDEAGGIAAAISLTYSPFSLLSAF